MAAPTQEPLGARVSPGGHAVETGGGSEGLPALPGGVCAGGTLAGGRGGVWPGGVIGGMAVPMHEPLGARVSSGRTSGRDGRQRRLAGARTWRRLRRRNIGRWPWRDLPGLRRRGQGCSDTGAIGRARLTRRTSGRDGRWPRCRRGGTGAVRQLGLARRARAHPLRKARSDTRSVRQLRLPRRASLIDAGGRRHAADARAVRQLRLTGWALGVQQEQVDAFAVLYDLSGRTTRWCAHELIVDRLAWRALGLAAQTVGTAGRARRTDRRGDGRAQAAGVDGGAYGTLPARGPIEIFAIRVWGLTPLGCMQLAGGAVTRLAVRPRDCAEGTLQRWRWGLSCPASSGRTRHAIARRIFDLTGRALCLVA